MSGIWQQFARTWGDDKPGFGRHSYNDAIAAGYTNQQIQNAIAGRRVGTRAQDMIAAGLASDAQSAQRAADAASGYQSRIRDLEGQIGGYTSQISNLNNSINNYVNQVGTLTNQYNTALNQYNEQVKETERVQGEADEFERQFTEASARADQFQAEADRYREEAVGQQLRAVRSGSTAGGANQSGNMQGSLTSGRTGYSSDKSDIGKVAEILRAQGGLTDSVLNRKGPVVEQLSGGGANRVSAASDAKKRAVQQGTGSYYATRF